MGDRYPLMLASTREGDPLDVLAQLMREARWSFEFKMDGIRALTHVTDDGAVRITNRTGRDITYRYPEVVRSASGIGRAVVLDGEIVCVDAAGRPDFHLVQRRDAQATPTAAATLVASIPAQLVAFDVLALDEVDLRILAYSGRRERLVGLQPLLEPAGVTCPPVSADGPMMWRAVTGMGLEGLVAKRLDSRYMGGRRSAAWVKVKATRRVSALVSGFEPGEGSRARSFGALRLSLLDTDRQLRAIGSVGSGFSEADLRQVWGRLQSGDPIVVEVAYLEVAPSGHLRQPVFKGIRSDIDPSACTVDQLHRDGMRSDAERHPNG